MEVTLNKNEMEHVFDKGCPGERLRPAGLYKMQQLVARFPVVEGGDSTTIHVRAVADFVKARTPPLSPVAHKSSVAEGFQPLCKVRDQSGS